MRHVLAGITALVAVAAIVPGAFAAPGPPSGPLSATPSPLSFLTPPGPGTVTFTNISGAPVQVTAVNTYSGPATPSLLFTVQAFSSSCSTLPLLAPAASCNVDIALSFAALLGATASLVVDSSAGPSFAHLSYGPAGPPPGFAVQISPLSYFFGPIVVGSTSAPATFTVTNNGASPIALSPSTGASYTVSGGTCGATLAVAASCTYLVTFSPSFAGPEAGFLDVLIGGGPSFLHVNLNGDGTVLATAASVSPSLAFFPTTLVGSTSLPLAFTVTNVGINTLVWSGGTPGTSTEFTFTGGTCLTGSSVPPGGTCTAIAVFNPTSPGTKIAAFAPAYNGPPATLSMKGVGYVIQPGAGSQGGGYVLVGGPNIEVNRDRFEWAVRERADGSLYGKSMTYRFTEAGTRYVARVAISSISTGSFSVAGLHASFDGAATLAAVVGSTETPIPGMWFLHVESDDVILGSNNGAGFDRVFIQVGSSSGLLHQTGSPGSPAVITWGAVGNGYPWVA